MAPGKAGKDSGKSPPTPTPPTVDLASIMEMLVGMKTDNLAMEARIREDNRSNTEQVENRINTSMETRFGQVQADITALNKTSMEQAAKIDKLSEALTNTEAGLARARGLLQNNRNESDTDLYVKQVYCHNIAKIYPALEKAWQIHRPGPREDIANYIQQQFERDAPTPELGPDDPLDPLKVPNRHGNANTVLVQEVSFFNPKAKPIKDGDTLPCILTFNHASTARQFRSTYQAKFPGIVSQAALRGNPEFNKTSSQVKRIIHALKSQNLIGGWDFRPSVNKKSFNISYSLQIRPDRRFQGNVWLGDLQKVLGSSPSDPDCVNFITHLLNYPIFTLPEANIKQVLEAFAAPRTRVPTRSSNLS